MSGLYDKEPVATLELNRNEIKEGIHIKKIKEYVDKIKNNL